MIDPGTRRARVPLDILSTITTTIVAEPTMVVALLDAIYFGSIYMPQGCATHSNPPGISRMWPTPGQGMW